MLGGVDSAAIMAADEVEWAAEIKNGQQKHENSAAHCILVSSDLHSGLLDRRLALILIDSTWDAFDEAAAAAIELLVMVEEDEEWREDVEAALSFMNMLFRPFTEDPGKRHQETSYDIFSDARFVQKCLSHSWSLYNNLLLLFT